MVVKTNIYAGSLEEAYDCICLFRLVQCDPVPEPLWIYDFPGSAALMAFVLDYGKDGWLEGDTAIVPDSRKNEAEHALQNLNIHGVHTMEIFALDVWGSGDEAVFDALFR